MAKNKYRQLAIVRRLRGPRKSRAKIGLQGPILFAAIIIIAMALDMCAFPLSRRNVVLAQSCVARLQPAEEEAADELAVVEKVEACQ